MLGRVCMDQMVVDVTDIPEVRMGDEAVLLGGKGGDSFFDAAQKIGTISYELVCSVARRAPRVQFICRAARPSLPQIIWRGNKP